MQRLSEPTRIRRRRGMLAASNWRDLLSGCIMVVGFVELAVLRLLYYHTGVARARSLDIIKAKGERGCWSFPSS